MRRRERQHLVGVAAERLGGGQRQHRAGCACRRRAASSASPPRGRPCAGSSGEAQLRQVGVDLLLKLDRVGRPRAPCAQRRRSWPAGVSADGAACRTSSSHAEAGGQLGTALAPGRRPRPASSSPERSCTAASSSSSARVRRAAAVGSLSSRRHAALALHRAEDAVDEPGRVRAAELLGGLDRLVDRHLGGHVRRGAVIS